MQCPCLKQADQGLEPTMAKKKKRSTSSKNRRPTSSKPSEARKKVQRPERSSARAKSKAPVPAKQPGTFDQLFKKVEPAAEEPYYKGPVFTLIDKISFLISTVIAFFIPTRPATRSGPCSPGSSNGCSISPPTVATPTPPGRSRCVRLSSARWPVASSP